MAKREKFISRRHFIQSGGALLAGSAWGITHAQETQEKKEKTDKIKHYRKLGRTGFEARILAWAAPVTGNRMSSVMPMIRESITLIPRKAISVASLKRFWEMP